MSVMLCCVVLFCLDSNEAENFIHTPLTLPLARSLSLEKVICCVSALAELLAEFHSEHRLHIFEWRQYSNFRADFPVWVFFSIFCRFPFAFYYFLFFFCRLLLLLLSSRDIFVFIAIKFISLQQVWLSMRRHCQHVVRWIFYTLAASNLRSQFQYMRCDTYKPTLMVCDTLVYFQFNVSCLVLLWDRRMLNEQNWFFERAAVKKWMRHDRILICMHKLTHWLRAKNPFHKTCTQNRTERKNFPADALL